MKRSAVERYENFSGHFSVQILRQVYTVFVHTWQKEMILLELEL